MPPPRRYRRMAGPLVLLMTCGGQSVLHDSDGDLLVYQLALREVTPCD